MSQDEDQQRPDHPERTDQPPAARTRTAFVRAKAYPNGSTGPLRHSVLYDLGQHPYGEQLRWRSQHCTVHAPSRAVDVALTQWQVSTRTSITITSAARCRETLGPGAAGEARKACR